MRPGALAPELPLHAHHGEVLTLRELSTRGSLLVVFYPFAYSPVCAAEIAELIAMHSAFAEAECRVVAVSCDSKFTLAAWATELEPPFDLLSDFWPHGAAAQALGTFDDSSGVARRGTFLFDAHGHLHSSRVSRSGTARDFAPWLDAARSLRGR